MVGALQRANPQPFSTRRHAGERGEVDHEDLVDGRGSLAVFRCQEGARVRRWLLNVVEPVDLAALVEDPTRVATVPPGRIPAWLSQLSALQGAMAARLIA